MRFYTDDERLATVTWYFVPPGTPFVTTPTPFRSLNWWHIDEGPYDVLGEQIGSPRQWYRGNPVGDAAATNFCGTADQWRNGQPLPPAVPTPVDVFGTPVCCEVKESPFIHFDCAGCPDGSWDTYFLGVFGSSTAVFRGGNGRWALRYIGFCTWESEAWPTFRPPPDPPLATWRMLRVFAETIVFPYAPPLGFGWNWADFVWDCLSNHTFPVNNPASLPAGEPLTVTVLTGDFRMQAIGTIILWAGNVIPAGFLLCNGAAVSRVQYAELFSVIGTTYGAGDGVNTFNIPTSGGWPNLAPVRYLISARAG